ncbi:integumentary mucin C.1 [Biomphalaria glabrata]|nr:integumentary mucin C.1-like [Biomphalaria glabrata]
MSYLSYTGTHAEMATYPVYGTSGYPRIVADVRAPEVQMPVVQQNNGASEYKCKNLCCKVIFVVSLMMVAAAAVAIGFLATSECKSLH